LILADKVKAKDIILIGVEKDALIAKCKE